MFPLVGRACRRGQYPGPDCPVGETRPGSPRVRAHRGERGARIARVRRRILDCRASTTAVEGGVDGLPGALGGAEALVALVLDDEVAEVAARVDWTAAELTSTLLSDDTVYVTDNGRVGYADPALAAVDRHPGRPTAGGARRPLLGLHAAFADGRCVVDLPGFRRPCHDHHALQHARRLRPGERHRDDLSTPFDRDGNPSSLSAAEIAEIEAVWQIVAEDYAPFNVDVTTEDPGDPGSGIRAPGIPSTESGS